MHCRDVRLRLWKGDREHLIHVFNRQLEGGRPLFIASGTIILGVLVYLLLLV